MLVGEPYLVSDKKRFLDRALVEVLTPARSLARSAALHTFLEGSNEPYVLSERLGKDRVPFMLQKLATRAGGDYLSPLAHFYESTGLDELEQIEQVLLGDMSFFGARPLPDEEHDKMNRTLSKTNAGRELLAEHEDVVMPHPPGIISTFGIQVHFITNASPEIRLQMNIEDCRQASLSHDLRLLLACTKGVAAKLPGRLLKRALPRQASSLK